ncbi:hypothetical protein ACH5RR_032453 [Cinchona calisaya]|uniref:Uncharacterized protein n=1 Tax=Cinchona calisaya TaxID=153742 RepID=A0ABD2YK40_9GENT
MGVATWGWEMGRDGEFGAAEGWRVWGGRGVASLGWVGLRKGRESDEFHAAEGFQFLLYAMWQKRQIQWDFFGICFAPSKALNLSSWSCSSRMSLSTSLAAYALSLHQLPLNRFWDHNGSLCRSTRGLQDTSKAQHEDVDHSGEDETNQKP